MRTSVQLCNMELCFGDFDLGNCLYILKTLLVVQTNFDNLDENLDHGFNTRFKDDFLYPRLYMRDW